MTFSILGSCDRSGKIGLAVSTSTAAIGGRQTLQVVPGKAAFTIQAYGSHPVALLARNLIELGYSPAKIMSELGESDKFHEYRQIAVLRPGGDIAVRTGADAFPWAGEAVGKTCVACGNVLVGPDVVQSMRDSFEASPEQELEERLMLALEAGRNAGGQPDGQTSAWIVVYHSYSFPIVDLRVDMNPEPVGELRKIFNWFKPLIPYYIQRTADPTSVPRYKQWMRERNLPLNTFAS